jgi:hypothetical protein
MMDSDLMLVTGIILGVLSIPAMLNAFADGRAPRLASVVVLIAGVLIFLAVNEHKPTYTPSDLPDVFARVFRRLMN